MVAAAELDGDARLDLKTARVLCADENTQGLDILGQILFGFGVQHVVRAQNAEEFRRAVEAHAFDLVLVDGGFDGNGYEMIRWLRRSNLEPNRYVAVLVLSGHTPRSQVEMARDCGSSFVVTKPISARTLLERIVWTGRAKRLFVECDEYAGPDRRFRNEGLPDGMNGRRRGDLSADVGTAVDPNMTQDEIDSLMKPQRMTL